MAGARAARAAWGIEIGSHTVSHADLTDLEHSRPRPRSCATRGCKLERRLGHPVQWLAYPFGSEDARIVALARQAGYVTAVTTSPGRSQSAGAPLELHRYEILATTGVGGLASLLGGG